MSLGDKKFENDVTTAEISRIRFQNGEFLKKRDRVNPLRGNKQNYGSSGKGLHNLSEMGQDNVVGAEALEFEASNLDQAEYVGLAPSAELMDMCKLKIL
ncbi:hypothetical protein Godav_021080 [Gossypium davidsonii]|uniref:Uncharacterized protein n=2 Tax=Gossypium TaxID=3633 RepID=A0A7J8R5R0_GOSDV|nr:hypothetical protein [Gossypium davidsonii]MBA0643962.1 hypothetical protein [Gossypium klotzschianum]